MSSPVDYDRVRRMCLGPSGSSYIEQFFGEGGEVSERMTAEPPVLVDSEGTFVPLPEEVRMAAEAKTSELEGNKYMDGGKFNEAIPFFEKAADLSRTDGILCQNVAVAWSQLGNVPKAREAITEALRREPSNLRIAQNAAALGVKSE